MIASHASTTHGQRTTLIGEELSPPESPPGDPSYVATILPTPRSLTGGKLPASPGQSYSVYPWS